MKPVFAPRGFAFLPLQTPWVRAFFHLPDEELISEMRVVFCNCHGGRTGQAFGGADAIVELATYVWWAWPLVALAQIPGVPRLLRAGYRAVAVRRYCVNSRCSLPPRGNSQNTIGTEGETRI